MEDKELLSLFTDMTRIHTAYVEHRLIHLGLHAGQGAIISALGEYGPCSQKELAEYRHVSAATISVMLRRMAKSGLIDRRTSEDGKCNEIILTDEGQKVYAKLNRHMEGEAERVLAGLSEEDKIEARHLFSVISENLEHLTSG